MKEQRKTYTHDSYGQISLGKSYGGSQFLYGSNIKHENTIRLEISHSEHDRRLNSDRYHKKNRIVEAVLSPTQFSELIMSRDNYEGVPCTLRFTEKKGYIKQPEIKGKVEEFEDEFKEHMLQVTEDMVKYEKRCAEILGAKGTVKVAEKKEIMKMMSTLVREMRSNVPYIYDCFNGAMDKTILEAKGEVEAFVENKIRSIGVEHAGGEMIVDQRDPNKKLVIEDNTEDVVDE